MTGRTTMTLFHRSLRAPLALALLLASGSACAQATRTWVSGVGDDANPCSRTAPCKTFAGAISKTAAGGEISVLDPGAYGTVTITKAITIDGRGQFAGVLASGTNGINVQAGASDIVILRNLSIGGITAAPTGVSFRSGAALHLDQVRIMGFTNCLAYNPVGATTNRITAVNTTIEKCSTGVRLRPADFAGSRVVASFDGVRLANNSTGMRVEANAKVGMRDSMVVGNTTVGIVVLAPDPNPTASVALYRTLLSNNAGDALNSGLKTSGLNARGIIGHNTVTNNFVGLLAGTSSQIRSFGDNNVNGNATDGAPTVVLTTD